MILEHKEFGPGPALGIELPPIPRKYTKHILRELSPIKVNLLNGEAVRLLAEDVVDSFNGSPKLRKDIAIVMKYIPNDFAMEVIDRACCRTTVTEKHMSNVAAFLTHKEISDPVLLGCIRQWSLWVRQSLVSDALAIRAAKAFERLRRSADDEIPGYCRDKKWEWGKPDIAITHYAKGGIVPLEVAAAQNVKRAKALGGDVVDRYNTDAGVRADAEGLARPVGKALAESVLQRFREVIKNVSAFLELQGVPDSIREEMAELIKTEEQTEEGEVKINDVL